MSNLVDHAKRELELAGLFDPDGPYNGRLGQAVLELVEKFSEHGHSGMSAALCIEAFSKVADFEPLTPLTGDESEWGTPADINQNNRCHHVFRDENGAYDITGRVFCAPDGGCFTSAESVVPITFPYTPKREYVDVEVDHE